MQPLFWISLVLMFCAGSARGFTGATDSMRGDHIQVQILSSELSLRPGATQDFAIRFQPDPHWHVYWKNPGDSGEPPRLEWKKPEGWTISEFTWPLPERIQVGPFYNIGYEGEVILPFQVSVPADLKAESAEIEVLVKWLVCKEECIPGQQVFRWGMPVQSSGDRRVSEWQPVMEQAQMLGPRGRVKASQETKAANVIITLENKDLPQDLQLKGFFPAEGSGLKAAPPTISGITITLEKDSYEATGPLGGLAVFQNGAGERVGYELDFSGSAQAGQGIWTLLLFAFLGGLILNIMPCVLPVLAIKVLSMVRESGANTRKVRLGSLAYAAGVLLSFLGLAGLLLLFKAGGEAVGWGFQLQSPAFIAALSLLFFLMALNFLDLIQPWNALTRLGNAAPQQSGISGHFWSGVLAVVVASPCTGPFMGVAVGSALTGSAAEALSIFMVMGLGFLSPFVALAWFPRARRWLPKPGAWMETFRQAMAFPLLLTLLWLLWVLEKQTGMDGVLWILGAFVGIGFATWLWHQLKEKSAGSWVLVLLLILVFAAVSVIQQKPIEKKNSAVASGAWQAFSPEAVAEARKQAPVFIDFTAAWCVTCQVNKTLVLNREDVQKAFAEKGVRLFRADWTDYDPVITQTLAGFGRQGVPVYVLYRDAVQAAQILPEVLTPDLLLKEIAALSVTTVRE